MNCKICGSPYGYTTDGRCKACIGKPEQFVWSIGGRLVKPSPCDDEVGPTREEEKRYYDALFNRK